METNNDNKPNDSRENKKPWQAREGDKGAGYGSRERDTEENLPESGWEAGAGISNAEFIAGSDDAPEIAKGPSDAGIGMAEIRKKKEKNNKL